MKKRIVILAALFIGLTIIFFGIIASFPNMFSQMTSMVTYVGKVGGERITRAEYSFFLNSVKAEMENLAKVAKTDEARRAFWDSKIAGKSMLEEAQSRALERLREVKIELIKAKESGISLSDEEKKEIKDAVIQKINSMGGEAQASQTILKDYGVTLQEYEDIFVELRIIYNFMKMEQAKIKIDDEEAKKYYNENREKVDKVTAVQVLIATIDNRTGEAFSVYREAEAKTRAEDILNKVRNGEDIKALAAKYSEDPEVSKNQGQVVVEYSGDYSGYIDEFKTWVLSHYTGDTEIVKSKIGYHVIKIIKRTEFSDVKNIAIDGARAQRFMEIVQEWKNMPQYNFIKNNWVKPSF
jgi:foldase protein PrsA